MESEKGWKWYGFAGHYICSSRCVFHLTTAIGGKYLVSTVGHFVPDPLRKPDVVDTVGHDRKFETMVFKIDGDDVHGDPRRVSNESIDAAGYNESLLAEQGHYDMCNKYHAIVTAECVNHVN